MSEYGTITFTKEDKELIRQQAEKVKRSLANYVVFLVLQDIERNKEKECD